MTRRNLISDMLKCEREEVHFQINEAWCNENPRGP